MDFMDPRAALDLDNIRASLIRMEDTILFNLIERAQFRANSEIYTPGRFDGITGTFLDWILIETEKMHSRLRRYDAPDENAFFPDALESRILPALTMPEILAPYQKEVSVNEQIKKYYVSRVVPLIGAAGPSEEQNFGSCALADVETLQAISRRIHFGKFVAESKYQSDPALFRRLITARDSAGIEAAITKPAVELQVLERIRTKAEGYGVDPTLRWSENVKGKVDPAAVVEIYKECIIPLTKVVEVDYLLRRLESEPAGPASASAAEAPAAAPSSAAPSAAAASS